MPNTEGSSQRPRSDLQVVVTCACGFRFRTPTDMAASVFCPNCGVRQGRGAVPTTPIPRPHVAATGEVERPTRPAPVAAGGFRHPRVKKVFWVALGLAVAAPILGWIVGSISGWLYIVAIPGILASWWFIGKTVFKLLHGLGTVLTEKELDVIPGILKLIAWDPIEGVVLLKHKSISFVDDDVTDGGGVQLVLPILGEELALRVPLDVQTLSFKDANVLTREYVPLSIVGTMYWKIENLRKFYLFVSREIHHASDRGSDRETVAAPTQAEISHTHAVRRFAAPTAEGKLGGAEEWLRMMAEQVTRRAVAEASTGLLFAEEIAGEAAGSSAANRSASAVGPLVESSGSYRRATDGLAEKIHAYVGPEVSQFGIHVSRVALQEVSMPPEVRAAAVESCKSTYRLLQRSHDASGRRLMLEAERSVLGAEALGLREIAGAVGEIGGLGVMSAVAAKVLEGLGSTAAKALPASSVGGTLPNVAPPPP